MVISECGGLPPPHSKMQLSASEFDQLVEEALEELPDEFARLLDNVVVIVEEEPGEEDRDVLGEGAADDELLGIYRGIALPERSHDMLPALPDQIAIFRGPILRVARSRRQIVREVRETVIHELGHYFGLHDDEMVF
ncbi:MAG TPA: metallopeptidase family protein [Thermoanaerobaculia bacterium]|nr:metallopeptidase family protein [Thermoanaerobaculia bacterium]